MDEYVLTKHDEVLLLNKGFTYETFGTLWNRDSAGDMWCCDPAQPGEYLTFYGESNGGGVLSSGRTLTRQEFEELFA